LDTETVLSIRGVLSTHRQALEALDRGQQFDPEQKPRMLNTSSGSGRC
jgi:hypothetical protein